MSGRAVIRAALIGLLSGLLLPLGAAWAGEPPADPPGDAAATPAEGDDAKPAEGDGAKPNDGDDAKPAEGDGAKPNEGDDAKPAERDDAKPAEGDGAGAPEDAQANVSELPKCERRDKDELLGKSKDSEAAKAADMELQGERLAFEKAVQRYMAASEDYRGEIRLVLENAIGDRRAMLGKRYDKQVDEVELSERAAREEAIRRFEIFVKKYPNDTVHTPDAMFRLAELYYERSAVDYADALEQYEKDKELYDRGKIPSEPKQPMRSYADSVRVYRELLARFGSSYRYADAVYYLLGYVHNESAEDEDAKRAWLELVQRFPKSEYAPEVILRIGEIHFDYGEFAKAAQAYKRALAYSDSKYYDKALYKLAWTYFQLYDYDSAIRTFKDLIAWYDTNKESAGETGSALRKEAVDYLAKSLAEDDWDNDGLKDPNAGVERALAYLSDGAPYELDVIEEYARSLYNLHDRDKYQEAIDVYQRLLARAPLDPRAAEYQRQIIKIYDILRDVDRATAERQKLAEMFAKGSPWYEANKDNPLVIRKATDAVEMAMRERALWHHQRAQELKTQARLEENPELLRQSRDHYEKAAMAYTEYLRKYPNQPASYEMAFYKAETLYYSGRFKEAADAYMFVAANPHKDQYRESAAWSSVKSYEKIIGADVKAGRLPPKADPYADYTPPEPEAVKSDEKSQVKRIQAEPMPPLVKSWQEAIDFYINKDLLREGTRAEQAKLAYQAADMSYRFQHHEDARDRFKKILSCYPNEEVAANAIAMIINSYREENDWPNLEKWADLADKLKLGDPEVTAQIRKQIKIFKLGAQFQHAEALYREEKFLEAAREFERLADQNPKADFADKAYFNAALAYKKVKYYDSAVRLFEKLVTDPQYKESGFRKESLFELAENYRNFFYFDKAITAYLTHFNRYPDNPDRHYMLYRAAEMQEFNGDYAQAARNFERYASMFSSREDAPGKFYRAGELYQKMGNESEAERVYEQFIDRYASKPGMDALIIEAKLKLARMAKAKGRITKAKRYWRDVIREYAARGQQPGSAAARAAAESKWELVEQDWKDYAKIRLRGSQKAQQYQLKQKIKKLGELQNEYADIFPYKSLDWTICGYFRLGDLFREMAKTLYAAPEPQGLSSEELDAYITMIEDEGLKFENVAIERLAVTVQKSREFKVTNECARDALEAINKYRPADFPLFKEEKLETVFEPVYTVETRIPEGR